MTTAVTCPCCGLGEHTVRIARAHDGALIEIVDSDCGCLEYLQNALLVGLHGVIKEKAFALSRERD